MFAILALIGALVVGIVYHTVIVAKFKAFLASLEARVTAIEASVKSDLTGLVAKAAQAPAQTSATAAASGQPASTAK